MENVTMLSCDNGNFSGEREAVRKPGLELRNGPLIDGLDLVMIITESAHIGTA
jgi:hypothetical protein